MTHYNHYTRKQLIRARMQGDYIASASSQGVAYLEELAGSQGMDFALLREPAHSNEDIDRAKRWLRANRDVVTIRVLRLEPETV